MRLADAQRFPRRWVTVPVSETFPEKLQLCSSTPGVHQGRPAPYLSVGFRGYDVEVTHTVCVLCVRACTCRPPWDGCGRKKCPLPGTSPGAGLPLLAGPGNSSSLVPTRSRGSCTPTSGGGLQDWPPRPRPGRKRKRKQSLWLGAITLSYQACCEVPVLW